MAAKELAEAGFFVIVFGEAYHPEVEGLLGWAGGKGLAVLSEQTVAAFDRLPRKLGLLSQTTQSSQRFSEMAQRLIDLAVPQVSELRLVNTICEITRRRQVAALKLASTVELMVVVGDHNSANTKRLTEICAAAGTETHLVEGSGEIEESWLRSHQRIGVTSGASTPDEAIDEVLQALERMNQ